MPFLPLEFPPGVIRPATVYDAKGRWYDTALVRWHDGVGPQPIGGWSGLANAGSAQVGGPVRSMISWRRDNGNVHVFMGTHAKAFSYTGTTLTEITPASGFTAGATDASGTFYARVPAGNWQVDVWGEDLIAVHSADGFLWYWDSSTPATPFVKVSTLPSASSVPTSNAGVVVTPENFVAVLGADGVGRRVEWSDQDSAVDFDPDATDQAGAYVLASEGNCVAGRRGRNETLIWTDIDVWAMRYIAGALIYKFDKVGSNCGPASAHAMGMMDGQAIWMGQRGFFIYDGFTKPIDCEVGDYVFNRLNREQMSKVYCDVRSEFHEVWWYYPSDTGANTENDSAVVYNYKHGHWRLEVIERTAGIDRGLLEYPMASDASGAIYEHEQGTTYQDEGGTPSYAPYATSGPLELGQGDHVMHIREFIPDEATSGQASVTLYTRPYPNGTETTHGAFTSALPTKLRATGRQVRVRYNQVSGGWRVGTPRLEVVPGGLR